MIFMRLNKYNTGLLNRWATMGKNTRERQAKACESCNDKNEYTLFRIRESTLSEWMFVCDECKNRIKQTIATYEYGGTWKRKKRN